jgi:uncharacterized protein YunC (DUF1805 family)
MNGRELPVKIKPTLRLSNEDIDIGDVKVGENISLEVAAKVKGIRQDDEIEKSKTITEYTFEVTNASVSSGRKKKEDLGDVIGNRLVE